MDDNLPAERDEHGRFLPGHKPTGGRPKGSKDRMTKLRDLLLDEAERPVDDGTGESRMQRLTCKLYDQAEDGDTTAARLILEYTVGRPKPVEQNEVEAKPFVAVFKQSAQFGWEPGEENFFDGFDPEAERLLLDDAPQLDG